MEALLMSTFLVTVAEMGDKTQLLAMAFATRFKAKDVLVGIFFATLAINLMAVVAGKLLGDQLPAFWVQMGASLSFILFGLWTLRGDKLEGQEYRQGVSPFWTVFVGFFLAELGDKTQLTTVALAAKYATVIPVWFGTTAGMLIAVSIGIGLGSAIAKHVSERTVKLASAALFIGVGIFGLGALVWTRVLA
jgi:putative Ca2+/H+ antiporter (TMEM165/GDT1 family)